MTKSPRQNSLTAHSSRHLAFEEYLLIEEPFYLPIAHEVEIFEAAHSKRLPILLKGPTGCGKTRFVRIYVPSSRPFAVDHCGVPRRPHRQRIWSAATCSEGDETRWLDGPLTRAVQAGAICYLDEVVEARKDTIGAHPSADPITGASCPSNGAAR